MLVPSLMLLAALQLGGAGSATPTDNSATTTARSMQGAHGPAAGSFELPTPQGPGSMHGLLRGPFGVPLFAVHAHVVPGGPLPGTGDLHGVLVLLVGPNPGPIAQVHGHWRFDPNGPDEFVAAFIVPGDPSTGAPPHQIGGMRGRFLEPNGPLPPAGHFRGVWHL
jgi:hypothetical protein